MPMIQDAKTGKWVEYDKEVSCHNCPDRCAEPNCHMDCPFHLKRIEEQRKETERVKEARKRDGITKAYFKDMVEQIRRRG